MIACTLASLEHAFRHHVGDVIPDHALFLLRHPGRYTCHDGVFVWLRPWHSVSRLKRDAVYKRMGYVFPVRRIGTHVGGWEPDPGVFFLTHKLNLGPWPVHDSTVAIWQLLLSMQLEEGMCVLHPTHGMLSLLAPYQHHRDF